MSPTHAQCPAVCAARRRRRSLQFDLGVNFFVNSRHTQQDVWTKFKQRLRQAIDLRQMRQRHLTRQQPKIYAPGSHVRERKEGYTCKTGLKSKVPTKIINIRRHVAVRQHYAFWD